MFCFRLIISSLLVLACAGNEQLRGGHQTIKRSSDSNFCGYTRTDAATNCDIACPGGDDSECPDGQQCFREITACNRVLVEFVQGPAVFVRSPSEAPSEEPPLTVPQTSAVTSTEIEVIGFDPSSSDPPSEAPSFSDPPSGASSSSDLLPIQFYGFEKAYSVNQGSLELSWNPPIVEGNIPEDVTYDIFVALGEYDFTSNQGIPELISSFQANANYQHIEVSGDTLEISLDSTHYGELHTLLITAQVSGEYSTNNHGSKVIVSRHDPHVNEGVDVIGVFVPGPLINIVLDDAPFGEEHNLIFSGSGVTDEAKLLTTGNYFSGFTSELESFIRLVTERVVVEDDLVMLKVVEVPLEDIFDQLDLSGVFSRPEDDGTGSSRRKLGWLDQKFKDTVTVVKTAVETVTIGGPLRLIDALLDTFGIESKLDEKFNVLGFDESWEKEISDHVTLSGGIQFAADMIVQMRIDGGEPYARVGLEADYSGDATLKFLAGDSEKESKTLNLWRGTRGQEVFMIGPVPVEVYWKPRIDFEWEFGFEFKDSAQIGVQAKGGAGLYAVYDSSLSHEVVPPSFERTYCLEVSAMRKVNGNAFIILSVDVGIYAGFLNADVGLGVGLAAEATTTEVSNTDAGKAFAEFDLDAVVKVPFQGSAFYGKKEFPKSNIFQKDYPLLPPLSVETEFSSFLQDYGCSCSKPCSLSTPFEPDSVPDNATNPGISTGGSTGESIGTSPGTSTGESTGESTGDLSAPTTDNVNDYTHIHMIHRKDSDENDEYCIHLANGNVENGNRVQYRLCDRSPGQWWFWDSNGYLRTVLDRTKCLIPDFGKIEQGRQLMISDCLPDDDRFRWGWYIADDSIFPLSDTGLCIEQEFALHENQISENLILDYCYEGYMEWQIWVYDLVTGEEYDLKDYIPTEETVPTEATVPVQNLLACPGCVL